MIENDLRESLLANSVTAALRAKYLGLNSAIPASSCAEIFENNPNAQTGLYFLGSETGTKVFCNFDLTTSSDFDEYGWERLSYIDMTDATVSCPSPFAEVSVQNSNVRYCRKNFDGYGCTGISFSSVGPINRIYGRIHGIQSGTPDIEDSHFDRGLDEPYVDGVSLTYGSPRNHIWSFIGYTSDAFPNCPCSTDPQRSTPDYIGENYFCESGTSSETDFSLTFVDDPIWDGLDCAKTQTPGCCNRGEWFYREFPLPVSNAIELRVCTDSNIADEDIGIQLVELYVQ